MSDIPAQPSGWPVLGHERAVGMLRTALRTGNLPHAYLFIGLPGSGKRTLAIAFAMTLNCLGEVPSGQPWPDVPCGICASCSKILRGAHPDLVEINLETQAQALGETSTRARSGPAKELRIDAIRELQERVALSPHSGRWKVCIIGDADRLNDEASNCLLKTLEEPPAQTILVLLAADPNRMLPTVSSRCFTVPLRPLPTATVAAALEQYWGVERDQAEILAALSGGRPGLALQLLTDGESLSRRRSALEELSILSGAPISERVNVATRLAKMFTEARVELYEMLNTWEGWWRDLMLVASAVPELATGVDQLATLKSLARKYSVADASSAVVLIQRTRQELAENVNPRLALESLVLGLP